MGHARARGGQASDEASGAAPRPTPAVAERHLQGKDTPTDGARSMSLSSQLRHRRRQACSAPDGTQDGTMKSHNGSCRCRAGRAGRRSRAPARKSSWPRCSTASRRSERLEGEVELLERLARGEAGGLDAGLAAVGLARVDLGLQQGGGEVLVAPLLLPRALGQLAQRPRRGRGLERAEEMGQLGRRRLMRSARRSGPAGGPRPAGSAR